MAKLQVALVPSAQDLAKLSPQQINSLMKLIDRVNTLEHRYAVA